MITTEIKTPKVTPDEAKDLKYRGFIPPSILRIIFRHLLKLMVKSGVRFSHNITDKTFFIGFSVPLANNPRLTESNLGQLKDILSEIQYIIKSSKY